MTRRPATVVRRASGSFVFGDSISAVDVTSPLLVTDHAGSSGALSGSNETFVANGNGSGSASLASDYTFTLTDGTLSITPRLVTVAVNDQSRQYGDANPTTGTVGAPTSGSFVFGDSISAVDVTSPLLVTDHAAAAERSLGATRRSSRATAAAARAWRVTTPLRLPTGTLSITPRPLTAVTLIGTALKVYDGTDAATLGTGNYSITGFAFSEARATIGVTSGTYAAGRNAQGPNSTVESGTITAADYTASSGTLLTDYDLSLVDGIVATGDHRADNGPPHHRYRSNQHQGLRWEYEFVRTPRNYGRPRRRRHKRVFADLR